MEDWITISDLRGGRNGADSPIDPAFPMNQVAEALNVDYSGDTQLGRKRAGASVVSLTGGALLTVSIDALLRHVPGATETAAQLFAVSSTGQVKRLTAGVTWGDITLDDAISGFSYLLDGVTFNGKLYLAYDSAVDRLHVYDSTLSSPRVRRVGFADPAIATVANTGAGAYAAVPRYYRVRWYQASSASGGTITRISEPGPKSTIFTPSGSGTAARITRPTAAGEGETHWGVEVSLDGVLWYVLAAPNDDALSADGIAIATTTYDDSVVTTTYSTYPLSEELGTHTNIPSVKFLITDGNRLIMAGNWENGLSSRVYYTPVLGSGLGDAERLNDLVDIDPFTDLNEKDGGAITGLGGPLPGGVIFAFKQRQLWRGTPTGDDEEPYAWRCLSRSIGSINHRMILLAEDQEGKPALYFWSLRGPYRIGNNGLEYMGRDIEDLVVGYRGFNPANLTAANFGFALWHMDAHVIYWYFAMGSSESPSTIVTLDVRHMIDRDKFGVRGGWVRHLSDAVLPTSGVMFANTLGVSMSADLKPYTGHGDGTLHKNDDPAALDDVGTDFQAYLKTRCIAPIDQLGRAFGVRDPIVFAENLAVVVLTLTLDRDFGLETQTATTTIVETKVGGFPTDVIRKFEGSANSDMGVIQIQIGDAAVAEGRWSLNALLVPITSERTK